MSADGIKTPLPASAPAQAPTLAADTEAELRRFRGLTAEQRHAAAMADPDCRPMTDEQWARAKRVIHPQIIRRRLRMSQEQFADAFHIPIGTLRDWEQRRKEPDAAARAYLTVIARVPDAVRQALAMRPPMPAEPAPATPGPPTAP